MHIFRRSPNYQGWPPWQASVQHHPQWHLYGMESATGDPLPCSHWYQHPTGGWGEGENHGDHPPGVIPCSLQWHAHGRFSCGINSLDILNLFSIATTIFNNMQNCNIYRTVCYMYIQRLHCLMDNSLKILHWHDLVYIIII